VGILILWALGLAVAATSVILIPLVASGSAIATSPAVVVIVLAVCMLLFGTLTVEVSRDRIALWFGPGLIRKAFSVKDIRRATVVRNPWYYGWGIRLTPHGWLFNVSGFDAVEIELSSGRKYRIGTDEPQELLSAIRRVVEAR
jgi:hypothetical protein